MKNKNIVSFFLYLSGFCSLLSITCFAYIDPASTSYIIQIIAGLCIAGGTAVGIFWSKLRRLFKKNKNSEQNDNRPSENAESGKTFTAEDILGDDADDTSEKT